MSWPRPTSRPRPGVEITWDVGKLTELLGHLSDPDPDFAIVTP
ncbi:hypothetical protein [Streptomyces laculatispora]